MGGPPTSETAMTYRSLLVLLDHDPLCAARTRAAMQLAARLDCHLVGVAPTGLIDLPLSPGAASSLMDLAALAWVTLRDRADEATQTVRDACREGGDGRLFVPRTQGSPSGLTCSREWADVRVETRHTGIAVAMLSGATAVGADLIGLGPCGPARWTERVLRGAARGLLATLTVPI